MSRSRRHDDILLISIAILALFAVSNLRGDPEAGVPVEAVESVPVEAVESVPVEAVESVRVEAVESVPVEAADFSLDPW